MARRGRTRASRQQAASSKQSQQRQPSKIGELDTTPTSRQSQSPQDNKSSSGARNTINNFSQKLSPDEQALLEDLTNNLDDDFMDPEAEPLGENQTTNTRTRRNSHFSWSEVGSQTRRSSPAGNNESNADIWEFADDDDNDAQASVDADLLPFRSSAESYTDGLPDTVPLPPESLPTDTVFELDSTQPIEPPGPVDFSETASTARRSSPFDGRETSQARWDFKDTSSIMRSSVHPVDENYADTLAPAVTKGLHYPSDELYEASPPPNASQAHHSPSSGVTRSVTTQQPMAPPPFPVTTSALQSILDNKGNEAPYGNKPSQELGDERIYSPPSSSPNRRSLSKDSPATTVPPPKKSDTPDSAIELTPITSKKPQDSRKRKQRAKTPLSFDEATQEIPEAHPDKKTAAAPRMPIVSALRDSVRKSASPVVKPLKKSTAKSTVSRKGLNSGKKTDATNKTRNRKEVQDVPEEQKSRQPDAALRDSMANFEIQDTSQDVQTMHQMELDCITVSTDAEEDSPLSDPPALPSSSQLPQQSPKASVKPLTQPKKVRKQAKNIKGKPVSAASGTQGHPMKVSLEEKSPLAAPNTTRVTPMESHSDEIIQRPKRLCREEARSTMASNYVDDGLDGAHSPLLFQTGLAKDKMNETNREKPTQDEELVKHYSERHSSSMIRHVGATKDESARAPLSTSRAPLVEISNTRCNLKGIPGLQTRSPAQQDRVGDGRLAVKPVGDPDLNKRGHLMPQIRPSRIPRARKQQPSRSFSISEKGSPILLEPQSPQRFLISEQDVSGILKSRDDETQRATADTNQNNYRAQARPSVVPTGLKDRLGIRGTHREAASESSKTTGRTSIVASQIFSEIHRPRHPPPPEIQLSKQTPDLRSQIFASFQRPNLSTSTIDTGVASSAPLDETKAYPRQAIIQSEPTISQELHHLIDKMVSHLEAQEAAIRNVPTTYGTEGVVCAGKIKRRFVKEHQRLVEETTDHAKQFNRSAKKARRFIEASNARRQDMVADLQETILQRQASYARATDGLRALHEQLVNEEIA